LSKPDEFRKSSEPDHSKKRWYAIIDFQPVLRELALGAGQIASTLLEERPDPAEKAITASVEAFPLQGGFCEKQDQKKQITYKGFGEAANGPGVKGNLHTLQGLTIVTFGNLQLSQYTISPQLRKPVIIIQ